MFRKGDKGVTRGGMPYEITFVDNDPKAHADDKTVVATVNDEPDMTYTPDGRFYATAVTPHVLDLLPPPGRALVAVSNDGPNLVQAFMLAIINGSVVPRTLGDNDECIARKTRNLADALIQASYGPA